MRPNKKINYENEYPYLNATINTYKIFLTIVLKHLHNLPCSKNTCILFLMATLFYCSIFYY